MLFHVTEAHEVAGRGIVMGQLCNLYYIPEEHFYGFFLQRYVRLHGWWERISGSRGLLISKDKGNVNG